MSEIFHTDDQKVIKTSIYQQKESNVKMVKSKTIRVEILGEGIRQGLRNYDEKTQNF